jgi:hypothetical protein
MPHRVSPHIIATLASLALVAFSENQALAWAMKAIASSARLR